MGRPLIHQRRGKGTPAFKAPSHRFKTKAKYRKISETISGTVVDLIDDPGRHTLVMKIKWDDGRTSEYLAPEGVGIGDKVLQGPEAGITIGNVLPLSEIPEGIPIFNLESIPGDGGALLRSSGATGYIVSKDQNRALVRMPSGKTRAVKLTALATIGVASGGGRLEKPLIKAGNAHYKHKARNHRWPKVRGVAMNPVDHPFGGKEHHPGKATTTKRTAPPGRKVGHIAARRTGRKKR